jgi:hypothetical protein
MEQQATRENKTYYPGILPENPLFAALVLAQECKTQRDLGKVQPSECLCRAYA